MLIDHQTQRSNAIPLAIGIAVLGMGGLWISHAIFGDFITASTKGIHSYLIPIAVVLIMYWALGRWHAFRNFGSHPASFFTKGWYLILAGLFFLALFLLQEPSADRVSPSAKTVALYTVVTLMGVAFEELLCRGLIQNILVEHFAESSPWRGIVWASGIFAALHFLNLFANPHFVVGTFTQVLYTFSMGMLLGTVYYLTGDLGLPMALHFVFNFLGSFSELFSPQAANPTQDLPLGGAVLQLAVMLPAIIVARRLFVRSQRDA